jgi:hypothetical protein
MHHMPELRRQQRVAYQTAVRVALPGSAERLLGRVTNVSRGGLCVTGARLVEAGAEVRCDLVLLGEPRSLRGRVAWVRPEADEALRAPGAGIELLDLTEEESSVLSRIVEPKPEERLPVDVWFEGMAEPIRSTAVIDADGLRLSTKLPFLRLRSRVRLSFSQDGVKEDRFGTLDSVTLDPSDTDDVPHLELGVTTRLPTPGPGATPTVDWGATPSAGMNQARPSSEVTTAALRAPTSLAPGSASLGAAPATAAAAGHTIAQWRPTPLALDVVAAADESRGHVTREERPAAPAPAAPMVDEATLRTERSGGAGVGAVGPSVAPPVGSLLADARWRRSSGPGRRRWVWAVLLVLGGAGALAATERGVLTALLAPLELEQKNTPEAR